MQKRFGFTADNAALRARELLQPPEAQSADVWSGVRRSVLDEVAAELARSMAASRAARAVASPRAGAGGAAKNGPRGLAPHVSGPARAGLRGATF